MRVDKMIGNSNLDTRKNIKRNAKKGGLIINGKKVKDTSVHVDPDVDEVYYMGELVDYFENIYLMVNKPAGLVSATRDDSQPTVMRLLDDFYLGLDLSIAGRLDKDTTGLLLMATDGKFIHTVTSPNSEIDKVYLAETRDKIEENFIEEFANGVYIEEDDYTARPAKLEILEDNLCKVTVTEGKFHLVKRLFSNLGNQVTSLKRIAIGDLKLDESLEEGEYRELSPYELSLFGY